jgi:acetyl-CoA acyltransferase
VLIRAAVLTAAKNRDPDDLDAHVARRAALAAYEAASTGPGDMDVCELHDATAFAEVLHVENLGFCARGEGGPFIERGATTLGGAIPVNVSGGLVSKGHPVGATGLAQIYELVTHLRGEAGDRQVQGARLAIAENGGGLLGCEEAVACITILERVASTGAA